MAHKTDAKPIPRAMSRTPLPPPPDDAATSAFVEALLDKKLDASLLATLATPEMMAARAARVAAQRELDWPGLSRYRAANAEASAPDLVMVGDSLTEFWELATPDLFSDRIVNRGIAGQTSGQILLRFYADVIELRPRRVHLLCGTNDVAGNSGPTLPEDYQRNVAAMADLARAHGLQMLVASLTPAEKILWSPDAEPKVWIPRLNDWLRAFAAERSLCFIDYFAELSDGAGRLREEFSGDGVHLTRAAYRVMRKLLEQALATT
jgi:lysophospholipase L1-like esterase